MNLRKLCREVERNEARREIVHRIREGIRAMEAER